MNFFIILILSIFLEVGFGKKFTAVENIEAQCAKYAKCPPCKNPLEAYSTCNNECLNGCYEGEAPSCPSVCEEGCFCKLGYKRYKDECVPEEKCSIAHTCSKPNEAFTDCGNRCIEKCGNRVCTKECQAGCFCIDGYKRNSAGDCVPEEKCCANPSCNDPNEEYTTCGNNCGESCNTPDGWMCPAVCKTGCFCRQGYKRHPVTGQCIPEKECPVVCENPNEEYYCGNKCQEMCGDDDRVCTDDCQLGCFCRKGLKRDPVTGQCICEKECPSACKDPNEVYTNCGNRCQEKCGDDDRVCTEECQIGCFCKKGFYRNYAGVCVPKENCTSCKDPNEEYTDCGTGCGEACGYENVWCKERCREGCFCRKGYKRHPITGQCVPEKECPKDSTCCKDPNEEWNENGDRCSEPCDREVLDCAPQEAPGCYCKKGYLRDQVLGICVPQEQCPLIGDNLHCDETTEEYRCGNRCWDYCEDGAIRDCLMDCRYGCHCKEGYKYDPQKKKCVKKEECPYYCPGHYEVFKLDGSACADRCNKHLVKCPDDRKPGCYCMDGYARDLVTNVCRPYPCEDCGEHASYQVCWSESCDNECRFVLKKDYCKIVHIKCPDGCHCDPGYARALNGTCIPECDCAADWEQNSCKGPNEEYTDCGSSCSEACSNEDTMCPDVCQKGCFCRKGYKRHPLTRECIPEKECPTKPPSCKDPNEEWNENGNPCSEACDRAVKICNSDPIPGCYCKKGYLRDQILGICVLEEQCPLLGDDLICDKSEEYKCGNNCWDICTADGVAIKCSGDCRYGCYCRDGFKRNSAGDCVPQEDCGSCKDPEVFTHCGNRCQEKCSDDDMRVCTLECEVGCFCKEGYYRNYAGICVPKENCTSCKDPNEEYTDCGTGCGEACGHENLWCKERCREGCFCRKGYKRHPITGQCVPEKECPKDSTCCKDPNEEWNENGHRCSESCNRDILDCTNETSPGCYCQKGYLRDPILGICVSLDQCPELGSDLICDETEEYRCGNNCWDYCEDGAIRDCPMDCRYGCYCKKGYKYDPKMKKCVKKEECPPVSQCTGHHEIFKPDGSACADRCNKHLVKCKDDRKPGCYCIDGYARDLVTNVCRPYPCEDCGEHASYQVCWNENCDNKCAFILKKDYCKIVYANVQCPDGCHCDPGYARALNGTCIPECDCAADWEQNSCKGPNEEYRFGSRCQDGCDRDIVRCIDDRAWGCYCMEGFARDKNTNVCVPYPCHPSKG